MIDVYIYIYIYISFAYFPGSSQRSSSSAVLVYQVSWLLGIHQRGVQSEGGCSGWG